MQWIKDEKVYSKGKTKIESVVDVLRLKLKNNFGVTLAPFLITKSEFKKRAKAKKSPVEDIVKEGKVISGISLRELHNG